MFDAKATDNSIDKSDDKNDEENDVVQNICSGFCFRVIDVHPTDDEEEEANYHLILNVFGIIIIIITRPKPAYGRQGLAGSWGQDTDQTGIFWGVLNHKKPMWNLEKL